MALFQPRHSRSAGSRTETCVASPSQTTHRTSSTGTGPKAGPPPAGPGPPLTIRVVPVKVRDLFCFNVFHELIPRRFSSKVICTYISFLGLVFILFNTTEDCVTLKSAIEIDHCMCVVRLFSFLHLSSIAELGTLIFITPSDKFPLQNLIVI